MFYISPARDFPRYCACALLILLVFYKQSQAATLDISATQFGNIDFTTQSIDALNLNVGGSVTGNVLMHNSSHITNFNGGEVLGSVRGPGQVNINASGQVVLNGSFGTSGSRLSSIQINNNSSLLTNGKDVNVDEISIGNGANFNYILSSTLNINQIFGQSDGVGSLTFTNGKTTTFNIGKNSLGDIVRLENLNIMGSGTSGLKIGSGRSVNVVNINIFGSLSSEGQNISATNINLENGSSFNINYASNIEGEINGYGTVEFSGAGIINLPSALGSNNKLAAVNVLDNTTLVMDNNINADQITIGEGASGVLTQNYGTLGADDNSEIRLSLGSILNYNGGAINGIIHGTSSDKGTFNVNHNYTNNFEIGKSYDLANLNIASGITLTANNNISANNINVAGALNLGNSAKIVTGNLSTSGGSAIINLGTASHNIEGNFSISSGDILQINALNNSNVGNLEISGIANVGSGLGLEISFDYNLGYLSDGTEIAIVSGGAGSTINAVADGNIDVNNSATNQYGLITFQTKNLDNNLFLVVDRAGAETFTDNKFAAQIYQNIDQIGANASDSLRNFQKFIDNVATSNSNRELALKSLIPQVNDDIHSGALKAANSSLEVIESVINKSSFSNRISFSDDIFDRQSLWLKSFKSSAQQQNVGDAEGYNLSNFGLGIGIDQEVDQEIILGVSAIITDSNIKSNSVSDKQTNIESYQFNLYGNYNFDSYFARMILGIAINNYNTTRSIPSMNLNAKADYKGQTYIAKIESGINNNFDNGLSLIPKIGLTMAINQVESYTESGADSLNLQVSNEQYNFAEGAIGSELGYNDLSIFNLQVKPKISISYGYNFISNNQSSKISFQNQNSHFQIENSNAAQSNFKYGFGLDIYQENGFLLATNYEIEKRSNYNSKVSSLYFKYDF